MHRIFLFLLCLSLVTAVMAQENTTRNYWPTGAWRTAPPEEHGLDADKLAEIRPYVEENMPFLDSLLIVKDGYLVYEEYFNIYDETKAHTVLSVTKSVTSALVGIALEKGDIESLEVTFAEFFPEYFEDGKNSDKTGITLRHLLMMRSGLEWDEESFNSFLALTTGTFMEDVINAPLLYEPGTSWSYRTSDVQLISGIFQQSTGLTLQAYAEEHLFAPLGITEIGWLQDVTGYSSGGAGLYLTPRDMAKFGFLYLNNGLWDGEQIVPADWVTLTTAPQDEAYNLDTEQVEPIDWYGYLWWIGEFNGYQSYWAEGYAGQFIFIFPELDMLVVTTANDNVEFEVAVAQGSSLIEDLLLPYVMASVVKE